MRHLLKFEYHLLILNVNLIQLIPNHEFYHFFNIVVCVCVVIRKYLWKN
jgi:hypothetical protein